MHSIIKAVAIAAVLAAPVVSFAQSNPQPLTRAEVRSQLLQLEKAGYKPSADEASYPVDIQAAEARVSGENGSAGSVGGAVSGSSEAGTH
jgi:hypothetical protein